MLSAFFVFGLLKSTEKNLQNIKDLAQKSLLLLEKGDAQNSKIILQAIMDCVSQEDHPNAVWIKSQIVNGKHIKAEESECVYSGKHLLTRVLKQYEHCIVENVCCNFRGDLRLGAHNVFYDKDGYEDAKNLLVIFENNQVMAVYDKDGKKIYPSDTRNIVWLNARMVDGKLDTTNAIRIPTTGEFLSPRMFAGYSDFFVSDVYCSSDGNLSLFGEKILYHQKKYVGQSLIAEYENKKLIALYDANGQKIYSL
ncbi:MAG TPA: hypothetical protein PKH98_06200, partial [Candidatus Omnitrophota bacterium]|nr:hypothetical protein [Candidatus Omnitrophota bacterium]